MDAYSRLSPCPEAAKEDVTLMKGGSGDSSRGVTYLSVGQQWRKTAAKRSAVMVSRTSD